jgi:hypothetical protein
MILLIRCLPCFRAAQGILVGEWWQDRLDCRQWGAHRPHVAGIAGQSSTGAQVCCTSINGQSTTCSLGVDEETQAARGW